MNANPKIIIATALSALFAAVVTLAIANGLDSRSETPTISNPTEINSMGITKAEAFEVFDEAWSETPADSQERLCHQYHETPSMVELIFLKNHQDVTTADWSFEHMGMMCERK